MVTPGDPPISDPEHERAAEDAAAAIAQPRMPRPEHLGDGVYASFDGYHVNLSVNDHRNHAVALDPYVLAALVEYARRAGVLR